MATTVTTPMALSVATTVTLTMAAAVALSVATTVTLTMAAAMAATVTLSMATGMTLTMARAAVNGHAAGPHINVLSEGKAGRDGKRCGHQEGWQGFHHDLHRRTLAGTVHGSKTILRLPRLRNYQR